MLHPNLLDEDAKMRYQEMLQDAEVRRRYQTIKEKQPGLLARSGDFLILMGQQLKAWAEPKTSVASLSKK